MIEDKSWSYREYLTIRFFTNSKKKISKKKFKVANLIDIEFIRLLKYYVRTVHIYKNMSKSFQICNFDDDHFNIILRADRIIWYEQLKDGKVSENEHVKFKNDYCHKSFNNQQEFEKTFENYSKYILSYFDHVWPIVEDLLKIKKLV